MQYSFSVIPRVSALIRLWPSFCQLVRGVVPRDKILVQSLAAFSRPDGIVFLFIRTEIIHFSFERDLCAPSSGAPVPVSTGHAAGVGGAQAPSASFQNGNGRTLAELEIFLQAAAAFPVARCKLVQRRVNSRFCTGALFLPRANDRYDSRWQFLRALRIVCVVISIAP